MFRFGRGTPMVSRQHESAASGSPAPLADGLGPGWYESSRELRCGLVVREGVPPDPPLHLWLDLHLHRDPVEIA